MKLRAKIWVSAPHEVDGFYVETISTTKAFGDVSEDSIWCVTVDACIAWANSQGVDFIEQV